jgi:hypothetical protein
VHQRLKVSGASESTWCRFVKVNHFCPGAGQVLASVGQWPPGLLVGPLAGHEDGTLILSTKVSAPAGRPTSGT